MAEQHDYAESLARLRVWLGLSASSAEGAAQPLPGDESGQVLDRHRATSAACQAELSLVKGSRAFRIGRLVTLPARRAGALAARVRGAFVGRGVKRSGAAGAAVLAFEQVFPKAHEQAAGVAWMAGPRRVVEGALRIALVADEFTADNLSMEAGVALLRLAPDDAVTAIEAFHPHLLLVESAWVGRDREWQGRLTPEPDAAVVGLVAHCKGAGIPTVFWNKEDPLHFEAFIECARLFDVVLTTDADCIPDYLRELGHSRVYAWPFALQQRLCHPVRDTEEKERQRKGFFAGAWYGAIPERSRDFLRLAGAFLSVAGLDIFDRNAAATPPDKCYPDYLAPLLRDAVPYQQMPELLRGYVAGLNVNSIKQSSTMFARRVLELIGANASVYSNYSLALHRLFGPLVVSTDDAIALHRALYDELAEPDALRHRVRRRVALRYALREHTWKARLRWLADTLNLQWCEGSGRPLIDVLVAATEDMAALARARAELQAQAGVEVRVWLAGTSADAAATVGFQTLAQADLERGPDEVFGPDAWLAGWVPADYHGPHYLLDLWLARSHGVGEVCGKAAFPVIGAQDAAILAADERLAFRVVERLAVRRALFPARRWPGSVASLATGVEEAGLEGGGLVSVDSLSYVAGGGSDPRAPVLAGDIDAPSPPCAKAPDAGNNALLPTEAAALEGLPGTALAALFNAGNPIAGVSAAARRHRMELVSSSRQACHWVSAPLPTALVRQGMVPLCLDARPSAAWDLHLEGVDEAGQPTESIPLPAGVNVVWAPRAQTAAARLVLRMHLPVVAYLDALWFGHLGARPLPMAGGDRLLVVTGIYPEAGRLYRNAFVHRRVKAYQARGIGVDVVCVSTVQTSRSYEFDGVRVHVCDPAALAATLGKTAYRSVAAHALDPQIWAGLAEYAQAHRVVAWLHGAEAQPWTRRPFNLAAEPAIRQEQITASDARMAFWKALLASPPAGLHLVFVSNTFASEFAEDLGEPLLEGRWSVIPNPVDRHLFHYVRKAPEQRFKVLSIRPHASPIYANDLVAATIHELAARPGFDRFSFLLVGDGPAFEENFSSLRDYPNVTLRRTFLPQEEIAGLHRGHGIFLVPTRGDTQGVSRDEAMASGLVPVSCRVGAVPEFVPPGAGILVPPESPEALADAILAVAAEADTFRRASVRAARVAGGRRTFDRRVADELALLGYPVAPV